MSGYNSTNEPAHIEVRSLAASPNTSPWLEILLLRGTQIVQEVHPATFAPNTAPVTPNGLKPPKHKPGHSIPVPMYPKHTFVARCLITHTDTCKSYFVFITY